MLQGFIITDDYKSEEAKKYSFIPIKDVEISKGTSLTSNYEKLGEGTASKDDEIYVVRIIHREGITFRLNIFTLG